MSVRRLPALIAAAFLAVTIFAAPSPVAAQALRGEPGEWVVGPINIKSSSGLSFCSMKTRYANGQSLVVASDSKGAHSLAIDFGKKTLSAGSQYYVTFYVGPVHRTMIAIAATTEVLISQMGNDPDFFMMMRSRETLEADFNNTRLSFSLKGSATALDELQTCAVAMGKGQGYAQAKVATPEQAAAKAVQQQAVAQEIAKNDDLKLGEQALSSSLGDEVRRLREENQRLRQENQIVAARLKDGDMAAAEAELAQLAELERQQRALQVEKEQLRAEQATLSAVTSVLSPEPPVQSAPQTTEETLPQVEIVQAVQPAAGTAAAVVAAVPAALSMPEKVLGWMNLNDLAPETAGGIDIWRWQTADVLVALQSWPVTPAQKPQTAAAAYLDILQSRCEGDFARKLAPAQAAAEGLVLQTAEVACIGAEAQAAAGLVFLSQGPEMAVVTYETATETMREALAQRALLISSAYLQR
ncbi:MAG: hypothetical protein Q8K65_05255 [Alphaproteobacteria bacterium]|nr:hypothetical protein [Alphaproteobacteria bacterium]